MCYYPSTNLKKCGSPFQRIGSPTDSVKSSIDKKKRRQIEPSKSEMDIPILLLYSFCLKNKQGIHYQ